MFLYFFFAVHFLILILKCWTELHLTLAGESILGKCHKSKIFLDDAEYFLRLGVVSGEKIGEKASLQQKFQV